MNGSASFHSPVERLAAERPGTVRLARMVSLAARVEPELLRSARVQLLPDIDAGAEADLWFSSLVRSRTPLAIVLRPDAVDELRKQLATEPEVLRRARAVLEEAHRDASAVVRLEETVTFLALSDEPGAQASIDELLQSAVWSMVEQDRRGIARWAARAFERLPQEVRRSEAGQMLDVGSRARLGARIVDEDLPADAGRWLPWVLPDGLPRLPVGVRLLEHGVELTDSTESGAHRIDLPETDPLLLEVTWSEGDTTRTTRVKVAVPLTSQVVKTNASEASLRTALGEVYRIAPSRSSTREATVRIASYNVENIFVRARAFNMATWGGTRHYLTDFASLREILEQDVYSAADKSRIVDLLDALGLKSSDDAELAVLRQVRGRLVSRTTNGVRVVADGRGDWGGWVELTTEPINDRAILNTARVIRDVDATVQGVVEVENRMVLGRFADANLRAGDNSLYPNVALVDGNDDRGMHVGLLTRTGWPIDGIRSHATDTDDRGVIFSRDCPEYDIGSPSGRRLVVLMNHLTSKGFGSQADNAAKRLRQATRVADIYRRLRSEGVANVAVLGDFNDTPGSRPLEPLLTGTDLRDISEHPTFDDGGRPGTFGTCIAANKIDYVLLSPALFATVRAGGIWRHGAWGGKNGTLWPHYETLTRASEAGSDHCAIWADVSLT